MKLIFSPLPVSSVKNHFEGCLDFVSAMELKSIILKCIAYKTNKILWNIHYIWIRRKINDDFRFVIF